VCALVGVSIKWLCEVQGATVKSTTVKIIQCNRTANPALYSNCCMHIRTKIRFRNTWQYLCSGELKLQQRELFSEGVPILLLHLAPLCLPFFWHLYFLLFPPSFIFFFEDPLSSVSIFGSQTLTMQRVPFDKSAHFAVFSILVLHAVAV